MGKEFREKFKIEGDPTTSQDMREFCQRPGRMDENGNPIYFTEQSHKAECDVNKIIARYDKKGIITHVSTMEAQFGDMTGMDFKNMQDTVAQANQQFAELPPDIRKRFANSVVNLLEFMESPDNRKEAIELGLIDEIWTPETDGLGEHVRQGENVERDPGPKPEPDQPAPAPEN